MSTGHDHKTKLWFKLRHIVMEELDKLEAKTPNRCPKPHTTLLELFEAFVHLEQIQLRGHSERYWENIGKVEAIPEKDLG